jgi:hypothetical protein
MPAVVTTTPNDALKALLEGVASYFQGAVNIPMPAITVVATVQDQQGRTMVIGDPLTIKGPSSDSDTEESHDRRTTPSPVADRGAEASPPTKSKKGGVMTENSPGPWRRRYGSYQDEELRALKFKSIREFEKAVGLIYRDSDLKGLPCDSPDGRTLFVPAESVQLFRSKPLAFRASKLISKGDMAPKRLAEMRAKHGM